MGVLSVDRFGGLDRSTLPADKDALRAREMHDYTLTQRGALFSLAKRPGYKHAVSNVVQFSDQDLIEERTDAPDPPYHQFTVAPQKRLLVYDKALDGWLGLRKSQIAGVFHETWENIDVAAKDYMELLLYYTNDYGNTWYGPYYNNTAAIDRQDFTLTTWPDCGSLSWACRLDAELEIDDTNLYVAIYHKGYYLPGGQGNWEQYEDVRVLNIPLTAFRDAYGDPVAGAVSSPHDVDNDIEFYRTVGEEQNNYQPVQTDLPLGSHRAVGHAISLQMSVDGDLFLAFQDKSFSDKIIGCDVARSDTWQTLSNITSAGRDLVGPLVRYRPGNDEFVVAYIKDYGGPAGPDLHSTQATYSNWVDGTVAETAYSTGYTLATGPQIGFRVLPALTSYQSDVLIFSFKAADGSTYLMTNGLNGTWNQIVSMVYEPITNERTAIVPIYDNSSSVVRKIAVYYMLDTIPHTTVTLYRRLYHLEEGTLQEFGPSAAYHVILLSKPNYTVDSGFLVAWEYVKRTGDEAPYTYTMDEYKVAGVVIRHAHLIAPGGTTTWASIRFVEFTSIRLESITQDWFEEDSTLQLTAQTSDDHLYRIRLNDETEDFIWSQLENDPDAFSFAKDGGRFRNDLGVIRVAAGNAVANVPVWYGYVNRDFFREARGTYVLSFDRRVQAAASLDSLETQVEIQSVKATALEDNLGELQRGSYEYMPFVQYDGFQYALPGKKKSFDTLEVSPVAADDASATDASGGAKVVRWTTTGVGHGLTDTEEVWIEYYGADTHEGRYTQNFDGDPSPVQIDLVDPDGDMVDFTPSEGSWVSLSGYFIGTIHNIGGKSTGEPNYGDDRVYVGIAIATAINAADTEYVNIQVTTDSDGLYNISAVNTAAGWVDLHRLPGAPWSLPDPLPPDSFISPLVPAAEVAVTDQGGAANLIKIPATSHGLNIGDEVQCSSFPEGDPADDMSWLNGGTYRIVDVSGVSSDDAVVLDLGDVSAPSYGNCNGGVMSLITESTSPQAAVVLVKINTAAYLPARVSGVGVLRRYRLTGVTTWSNWEVLGFAPIDEGEKVAWFSGIATYTSTGSNTGILGISSARPHPVTITGASQSAFFNTYQGFAAFGWRVLIYEDDNTLHEAHLALSDSFVDGDMRLEFTGSGDSVEPAEDGDYRFEVVGRWSYAAGRAMHAFFDTEQALVGGSFADLAGFSPDLDSIEMHYRDRCAVNGRTFIAGVMLDPSGEAEVRDDTVYTTPQSGDGIYAQDSFPPTLYLKFGRGDGDNIVRILSHGVGTDASGVQAEVLLIIKQGSMYMVDVTGDPLNWSQLRRFVGPGAVGRDAVVQADTAVYALQRGELYQVQGLKVEKVPSFRRLDGFLEHFSEDQYRGAVLGYVSGQYDWLYVAFPDRAGSNYRIFVWDRKIDEWYEFRYNDIPILFTRGSGYNSELSDDPELTGRLFFSDGVTVWLGPYGTDDAGVSFASGWIGASLGLSQPMTRMWVNRIAVAHYTEPAGADGTVTLEDEDGNTLAVTMTGVASAATRPSYSDKELLDVHGKSFEVKAESAASATRSEIDAIQLDVEEAPDTM